MLVDYMYRGLAMIFHEPGVHFQLPTFNFQPKLRRRTEFLHDAIPLRCALMRLLLRRFDFQGCSVHVSVEASKASLRGGLLDGSAELCCVLMRLRGAALDFQVEPRVRPGKRRRASGS